MKISGFQKMTLLDYPGKVACTLFTSGCNLRCPFCHNASLVTKRGDNKLYDENEILKFLESRKNLLDGVCISGGEPLLQNDIFEFMQKIKEMGFLIKLDTNGTNPKKLIELAKEKVIDYVAMDIKNSKEKYALTSGTENLNINNIEESVDFLLLNTVDYEFRTTVVDPFHTKDDILKIAKWIKGAKRYFLQNFVDSGNLIGNNMISVGEKALNDMCSVAREYVENTSIRGI